MSLNTKHILHSILVKIGHLLIIAIFCISPQFLHSQNWEVKPSVTIDILYSTYILNANDIWAVGDGPTVIYSSDGGENWVTQTVGIGGFINDIYFRNSNLGWAVASSGNVIKTTDGGNTWNNTYIGTAVNLYSVHFVSDAIGVLVGDSGLLRRTSDGGDTWNVIASNTSSNLWSIEFANSNVGYAVGAFGEVIKTTDGGLSWSSVATGFGGVLWDVSVVNEQIVYASGDNGAVYKTTNGGTSWSALTTGETQILYGVSFIDSERGYIAGEGGLISYTSNGGSTWGSQNLSVATDIFRIRFLNESLGIGVGNIGLVVKFELLTPQNLNLSIDEITSSKVTLSGNIANDNGSPVTSRGFVLSKSNALPTIASKDIITSNGTGLGSFTAQISNLEFGNTYYVRAYATNANGTAYGTVRTFTTTFPFILDGNGDGILDSLQSNVFTLLSPISDTYITIESIDCNSISDALINNISKDRKFVYPFGLLEFKANCATATVNIYYHGVNDISSTEYIKLNKNDIPFKFSNYQYFSKTIDGNITHYATLRLTDGGEGDYDGEVNGVIYDPGGPGVTISSQIPTLSEWAVIVLVCCMLLYSILLIRNNNYASTFPSKLP